MLVPPGQEIPVALLRLPDVTPTSGIGFKDEAGLAINIARPAFFIQPAGLFVKLRLVGRGTTHRDGVVSRLRAGITGVSGLRLHLGGRLERN